MRAVLASLVTVWIAGCGNATDAPAPQPTAPGSDPWAPAPAPSAPHPASDPWNQPGQGTPPTPPPPAARPARPPPPPHTESGAFVAGTYPCWLSGMGNYTASVLGTFTFDGDGSYRTTAGASGTYRVAGARLALVGGKLDGWVAAIETPGGGTLRVRFRADTPGDPGSSIKIGDHVCTLKH